MGDIARRFPENPLLSPAALVPDAGLEITCLLNPGVFAFDNKIWLIVRVAERPTQEPDAISFPILGPGGRMEIMRIDRNDPDLDDHDKRVIRFRGNDYLTTLSHLRLFCSEDGLHFREPDGYPRLYGKGRQETFGIEDCRVVEIDGTYYLTFTSVSPRGVAVGMRTTRDWKTFISHGLILPAHNKDCAIFGRRIAGMFYALHRPSSAGLGGHYIWIASSPDAIHWGNHKCIVRTRPGMWDSQRVGAGASPILTPQGWLEIYHGADAGHRYCLGAFLLDREDPAKVLARTKAPIMEPVESYERTGFFGHVVFTNGHILEPDGDTLTVYYGAADEFVCGARFSVREILSQLTPVGEDGSDP